MKPYPILLVVVILLGLVLLTGKTINANNPSSVEENIQKQIDNLETSKTIKLGGQKITGNPVITGIYKNSDYKPLWEAAKNRNDLISILDDSYYEGLNPNDYHIDFIKQHDRDVENGSQISDDNSAIADIVMTDALLTYAYHMIQGKVNPTKFDPNWNYSQRSMPDDAEFRVMHRLQTQSLMEGIKNVQPELPLYQELKFWFAKYDSVKKADGELKQIKYPGVALRLGDSSEVVGELKSHLSNYANTLNYTHSDVFDEELQATLKVFQLHHGLDDDGIAGKKTFEMLNMSINDRMDIIRINMERARWLNNDLPEEFILVNIADFQLYLFRNRVIDYNCRVVVGKEYHETPVFTSKIKYVVFNPTWTVPYSIASKETLPKLKRDPQYLQDRNMTLLRGNKVVDPSTVDFTQYSRKNFPFTIRQEPGPNNALGIVKFIFPNIHNVYLHDTPSKSYFEKGERAFSHGCVRVQNPLVLAEQVLRKQGYDRDKIDSIIKSEKLKNVYLDEQMTVMLMYWTCYEDEEEDKMYFYRDIYGRDKKILAELNESR
jgi:murein L,D-transpeptidase YcbB/YkuD